VVWNVGSPACFGYILRYVWHILGHFDSDSDCDILAIVIVGVKSVIGGLIMDYTTLELGLVSYLGQFGTLWLSRGFILIVSDKFI